MSEKIQGRVEVKKEPGKAVKHRKAYEKPAFEHERIFETMALACGKLSSTQATCRFNRKSS
jgi:hypothetical protein